MIGIQKRLGLVVLAAAVLILPASTKGSEQGDGKTDMQKMLEAIQRQLTDMQQDLRTVKLSRADIEEMNQRLDDLARRVRRLEGRLQERQAFEFTPPNPATAA